MLRISKTEKRMGGKVMEGHVNDGDLERERQRENLGADMGEVQKGLM